MYTFANELMDTFTKSLNTDFRLCLYTLLRILLSPCATDILLSRVSKSSECEAVPKSSVLAKVLANPALSAVAYLSNI